VALFGTRKRSLRARGIERRQKLLASARELLETREIDAISLGDVAAHADVPKGSAYHFYADIKDLYSALLAQIEEEMLVDHRAPITAQVSCWQDVIRVMIERGLRCFERDAAARQLLIGPKTPPDLKMQDRRSDLALAKVFEDQVAACFELPPLDNRSVIFFRALEIVDLMFSLSMIEHKCITPEMNQEAIRASIAYLESYFPKKLPKRRRAAQSGKH
jgi:AcrR family transcriptional regulator